MQNETGREARVADLQALLRRIVNLSHHPYFPTVSDLPAWQEAIREAEEAIR